MHSSKPPSLPARCSRRRRLPTSHSLRSHHRPRCRSLPTPPTLPRHRCQHRPHLSRPYLLLLRRSPVALLPCCLCLLPPTSLPLLFQVALRTLAAARPLLLRAAHDSLRRRHRVAFGPEGSHTKATAPQGEERNGRAKRTFQTLDGPSFTRTNKFPLSPRESRSVSSR